MSWVGIDLDGTLAIHGDWKGADHIGEPIQPMVDFVKQLIADGKDVRIFTARVSGHLQKDLMTGKLVDAITPIERWCEKHLGKVLPVTNVKDYSCVEIYDDRAFHVVPNTGRIVRP